MADYKETNTEPMTGRTFQDAIKKAIGKEDATAQEFEAAMRKRGYADKDIRRMTKAYDRIRRADDRTFADFIFREGSGYEFRGGRSSGRAKGNIRGFDVGDFIGLGNNAAMLAGALRNELMREEEKPAENSMKAKQANASKAKSVPGKGGRTTKFTQKQQPATGTGRREERGEEEIKVGQLPDYLRYEEPGKYIPEVVKNPHIPMFGPHLGELQNLEGSSAPTTNEFMKMLTGPINYVPEYSESKTRAGVLWRGIMQNMMNRKVPMAFRIGQKGLRGWGEVGTSIYDWLTEPIDLSPKKTKVKTKLSK